MKQTYFVQGQAAQRQGADATANTGISRFAKFVPVLALAAGCSASVAVGPQIPQAPQVINTSKTPYSCSAEVKNGEMQKNEQLKVIGGQVQDFKMRVPYVGQGYVEISYSDSYINDVVETARAGYKSEGQALFIKSILSATIDSALAKLGSADKPIDFECPISATATTAPSAPAQSAPAPLATSASTATEPAYTAPPPPPTSTVPAPAPTHAAPVKKNKPSKQSEARPLDTLPGLGMNTTEVEGPMTPMMSVLKNLRDNMPYVIIEFTDTHSMKRQIVLQMTKDNYNELVKNTKMRGEGKGDLIRQTLYDIAKAGGTVGTLSGDSKDKSEDWGAALEQFNNSMQSFAVKGYVKKPGKNRVDNDDNILDVSVTRREVAVNKSEPVQ